MCKGNPIETEEKFISSRGFLCHDSWADDGLHTVRREQRDNGIISTEDSSSTDLRDQVLANIDDSERDPYYLAWFWERWYASIRDNCIVDGRK